MAFDDLFARFRVADVDQSELEQVLLAHFNRSTGVSPREIHYLRAQEDVVTLIVRYDADGELSAIEAGTGLHADDVAQLEEKVHRLLLKTAAEGIGQMVLFAHVPTTGHFRYKDRFQILPVPPEAPRPPYAVGDHPLLVQFAVAESEDFQTNSIRRSRIGREIELLCVALTTSIWRSIGFVVNHHWVLTNLNQPDNWKSEFLQEGYTYKGANGRVEKFFDISGKPALALTPTNEYYKRVGITVDQILDLPADFAGLLDRFYSASREDRDRFLRAAFWFQHAQRVSNISRSASFTALVSAIEALMPPPEEAEKCVKCKRSVGKGPTAQFADFVSRFAPGPTVTNSDRRKLYSLRSALSHGGSLLHSDRSGWLGGMTGKRLDEWEDHRAMWRIARVTLVNWLRSK
jgi:hypothetical protein